MSRDDQIELIGGFVAILNAAFEERFLAAEFERCGIRLGTVPALCTLWLGQQTFRTPNYKLTTLVSQAGIASPDAHTALGDVRALAALLPAMLGRLSGPLGYPNAPLVASGLTLPPRGIRRPRTRAVALRRGQDGWMSTILARLPLSTVDAGDADAERYLQCLSAALEDGRIVGEEARLLAHMAGTAGLGAAQVSRLNQRFLESMREAAFADKVLTDAELTQLKRAAVALGVAGYFDDLTVTNNVAGPSRQRRCGNCRRTGHYRTSCPELTPVP